MMPGDPLRVIIVDDEALARAVVREYLAAHPAIEIVAECANGFDAVKAVSELAPDLMFLDVQMPRLDGFEVLELLGRDVSVIFTTAYDSYALQAFDVHAVDYLLKPVADDRFAQALARAKEQVLNRRRGIAAETGIGGLLRERSRQTSRILVRDRERTRILDVNTIDWIEAADYYALIHVGGEAHLLRETMNQLEERLDPARFFRVHRSAIVHVERVKEIQPLVRGDRLLVLADGTRVRLSRARREAFERLLAALGAR